MHNNVHLLLATSFSMIITFLIHCILNQVTSRTSIFQIMCFDLIHDSCMLLNCLFLDRRSKETCERLFSPEDVFNLYTLALIAAFIFIITLFYGPAVCRFMAIILMTMIIVEYLGRYIHHVDIYFKVDLITVYLFIWQPIALVCGWMWHELLSPILRIEQVSFCILTALEAFMFHNIALRYLPTKLNLAWLWLLSVVDIFLCLYHRGLLYVPSSNARTSNSLHSTPAVTYAVGDANGDRITAVLGLPDFIIYDILLLLALPPSSSIIIKILVTLGSIVSVQVGSFAAVGIFEMLWNIRRTPAVPLPVITFSIYLFILDIVTTSSSQCIEDSISTT